MDANIALCGTAVTRDAEALYANDGFEMLYRREYPGLVAVAEALSGGRRDAEDLVQDTMVRALLSWRRVGSLERPGGWCHRVLLNLCSSWRRRRRTEARWLSRQRVDEPSVGGPSPETVAFWAAVRQLPSRPRTAVALYYGADRSVIEVASILGVPEGTVRSDLTRARVFLADKLGA
jgi:RNA polymerase sigma-70 factor, ECF subfamily